MYDHPKRFDEPEDKQGERTEVDELPDYDSDLPDLDDLETVPAEEFYDE